MFKRTRHVRCEPQQARQDEQYRTSSQHIVAIKPRYKQTDVRPELPAHSKRNYEAQQTFSRGMLGRCIARNSNDAHVKQIDEEFIRSNLLRLFRAPQQALVEILPHNRFLVKVHERPEFALRLPYLLIERRRSR
jgi:hypothetical protein